MTSTSLTGTTVTGTTNALRRFAVLLLVVAAIAVAFTIGRVTAAHSETRTPSVQVHLPASTSTVIGPCRHAC
jgi:hypothetical protein